jgi:hypothetical protein
VQGRKQLGISLITKTSGVSCVFPGVGGSGFDLLHLDPRAIDLFDDVLDGGALQMNGLGFLFWRVLEHKTTSRRFSFLSSFASCSCRDTKWKGFCHRSGTTNKGGNLLTKRGFQRSFRYPPVELRDRVRAAAKERGFRSEQKHSSLPPARTNSSAATVLRQPIS